MCRMLGPGYAFSSVAPVNLLDQLCLVRENGLSGPCPLIRSSKRGRGGAELRKAIPAELLDDGFQQLPGAVFAVL